MEADFVFSEVNTNTAFTCANCSPSLELSVQQVHIIINGLSNMFFDRPLLDSEQGEIDIIMHILQQALEVNQ